MNLPPRLVQVWMQLRVAVQFESPAFEALIALRSRLIREILYENAVHTNGTGTWSAAFAKTGAVATAFLFPILLVAIGARVSCSMGSS